MIGTRGPRVRRAPLALTIAVCALLVVIPAVAPGLPLLADGQGADPGTLGSDAASFPLFDPASSLPRYLGAETGSSSSLTVHVFTGTLRSRIAITNPAGITGASDYANANYRQTIVYSGVDRVEVEVVAERRIDTAAPFPLDPASLPAEMSEFLLSRPDWIQADDPTIAAKARELVAGARLEAQAVENILAYVRGHLTYDLAGPRDALSVYHGGRAYCVGFANLAMALLRSVGIPARAQYGIVGGWDGWGSPIEGGRHEWIEVYYPDVGWVSSDPQVSANYIDTAHLVGFLAQGGKPGTVIERLAYEGANNPADPGYRYTRTAPVPTATGMPLHAATVPAAEGPALVVSPADVAVSVRPDAPRETIRVDIAAAGPSASGWRIESHAAWLVPLTPSGPTPGTAEIEVDGSQMPTGSDAVGTLSVLADPAHPDAAPRSVTVTLHVAPAAPPAVPSSLPFRVALPVVLGR